MKTKNMTTLNLRNSISRSPWRGGFLLIPLVLACFALLPSARALVTDPDETFANFNTAAGQSALASVTSGTFDTAYGAFSLNLVKTTSNNTAVGTNALRFNTGAGNTAVGSQPLRFNTTGSNNTAFGAQALFNNSTGSMNTAVGVNALSHNTTAADNTAVGQGALTNNTTGGTFSGTFLSSGEVGPNTAVGFRALSANVDAGSNTALGYLALSSSPSGFFFNGNTTKGGYSTAVGFEALASAVGATDGHGTRNDAFGYQALANLTTGFENVGIGLQALFAVTTAAHNTAVGQDAGFSITGNWNIDIGSEVFGTASDSHTTRIGISNTADTNVQTACFIGGITGVNEGGSGILPVYINNAGRLGTNASSVRFKHDIKPMDKASDAILALKPVTFHYKSDTTNTPQFGLIAEEVAKVNPDLVVRDAKGEINNVRYDAVNAMLLNEFLKEHQTVKALKSTVEKQEALIAQQQKDFQATVAAQQKQIEALTAGLQKVSEQVEMTKPAPKVVANQ
jgi:trimeric autotransporter adhesin